MILNLYDVLFRLRTMRRWIRTEITVGSPSRFCQTVNSGPASGKTRFSGNMLMGNRQITTFSLDYEANCMENEFGAMDLVRISSLGC